MNSIANLNSHKPSKKSQNRLKKILGKKEVESGTVKKLKFNCTRKKNEG